jgi:spermidine synthase
MRYFVENEPTSPINYRYRVKRILYRGRSRFQKILVFESPYHGRILALDDIVQLTTREEHLYHEVLVHPIMQAHPNPRHVLIIGGGDGGSLREVLKYPSVERVVECELDERVVEVAKKYFPKLAASYGDPRAQVIHADGRRFLKESRDLFDAIILDLTDPIGPAKPLFQETFYRLCANHLDVKGFLSAQTESLHFHSHTVRGVRQALGRIFPIVSVASIPLAMYPGNWWTFSIGAKSLDPKLARNPFEPSTRLYSKEDHVWFFVPSHILEQYLRARRKRSYESLT